MSELEVWMDKLGHMGTEDIRKLMREENVTGRPNSGSECVLANFLTEETGEPVGVTKVGATNYDQSPNGVVKFVPLPDTVRLFVDAFDQGRYPELATFDLATFDPRKH